MPRLLVHGGIGIVLLSLLAHTAASFAAPPVAGPDPYADAVDSTSSVVILNPDAAVGAPDGVSATTVVVAGNALVLDLGAGEEGTGDLTVTYAGIAAASVLIQVSFLDADRNVISSAPVTLAQVTVGTARITAPYADAPTPYRYVSFPTLLDVLYSIDAIEAATFRPDSDGDGLPDEWELQYSLDPLDSTGINGGAGDPDGDGLSNTQEYAAGTDPRDADTDNDGLPDGWEVRYNLNPLSPTGTDGVAGDPDGDGLSNAQEYAAGTNPRAADTDNDGLPDGWEVRYGLDPLSAEGANGAAGDPDGDGSTNAQEYAAGTNPTARGAVFLPIVSR